MAEANMTRQIPAAVLADLTRRGLDVGYLDRMDLSPFLPSTAGVGDPVTVYINSGKVPADPAARETLRKAGDQAKAWQTDAGVKAAGVELLRLLDEVC
jgi:hypothetical protein